MNGDPGLQVVLACTACQRTWEPDLTAPPQAWQTCCPDCGGWTWIAQLTTPTTVPEPRAGGGRR